MPNTPPPIPRSSAGFTLIEMLCVITIIVVISVIAIPMVPGAIQSSKLRNATNLLSGQLALARQTALSRNCRVEVRFYELTDAKTGVKAYRGISSYLISETGTATAIGKMRELPSPITISNSTTENTMFRNNTSYKGTENLPQATGVAYFKFSFYPSGRTDFDPGSNWFMTLYSPLQAATAPGQLPANYAVLQVDDFTGHVRIFRP